MLRKKPPVWTVAVLTIPQREEYLEQLFESLRRSGPSQPWELLVVYNWETGEEPYSVERRLKKMARRLPLVVHFNSQKPSIVGGRIQQLALCKSPLICFVDDDITLHGDVFDTIADALKRYPLGIVGIPSLVGDSDRLFKPRRNTPHVDLHGIRFMTVQGMLVAGYRRLFRDIGGFNPRRAFWGEWTELNLRMWRMGFPTGYVMNRSYLRHWHDAPESPTRNKRGREDHVLWGLLCTALEYEAIELRPDTESFWKLVEERYISYAFGSSAKTKELLASVLRLVPKIAVEWPHIVEFRERARSHPFQFAPFHALQRSDVEAVLAYAASRIASYRDQIWPPRQRRWLAGAARSSA